MKWLLKLTHSLSKQAGKCTLNGYPDQVGVPASTFASYGERENALYEHLDELGKQKEKNIQKSVIYSKPLRFGGKAWN